MRAAAIAVALWLLFWVAVMTGAGSTVERSPETVSIPRYQESSPLWARLNTTTVREA